MAGASEALERGCWASMAPGSVPGVGGGCGKAESPGPGTPCFDLRSQQPRPQCHCRPAVPAMSGRRNIRPAAELRAAVLTPGVTGITRRCAGRILDVILLCKIYS